MESSETQCFLFCLCSVSKGKADYFNPFLVTQGWVNTAMRVMQNFHTYSYVRIGTSKFQLIYYFLIINFLSPLCKDFNVKGKQMLFINRHFLGSHSYWTFEVTQFHIFLSDNLQKSIKLKGVTKLSHMTKQRKLTAANWNLWNLCQLLTSGNEGTIKTPPFWSQGFSRRHIYQIVQLPSTSLPSD